MDHSGDKELAHTQRAVVNGSMSKWRPVMCGVLQGSMLGLALFNVFVSDMELGLRALSASLLTTPSCLV